MNAFESAKPINIEEYQKAIKHTCTRVFRALLVLSFSMHSAHNLLPNDAHAFICSAAASQNGSTWQRYTGRDEEFTVSLPHSPSINSKTRPKRTVDPEYGRVYSAYADGIVYVVVSHQRIEREEELDDFINDFKKEQLYECKMEFERDLKLTIFTGKQYRLNFMGVEGVVQFYLANKHVYIVEAVGDTQDNPFIRRFLTSFTLAGKNGVVGKAAVSGQQELSFPQSAIRSAIELDVDQHPDQIFTGKEVTRKALAISRPEPRYTEEARRKNVAGVVILSAALLSSGKVDKIEVLKGLPFGLTENAIDAARGLKFIPAVKDNRFVSQHIRLEYNFSLY